LSPTIASSSIQAQRAIVAAGGGIGVLPCFLAGELVRVLPGRVMLQRRFWLNTHRDVQETARMKILTKWLKALVAASRARLLPLRS
jgi:DNA-binding transcriptional LysR family regulator